MCQASRLHSKPLASRVLPQRLFGSWKVWSMVFHKPLLGCQLTSALNREIVCGRSRPVLLTPKIDSPLMVTPELSPSMLTIALDREMVCGTPWTKPSMSRRVYHPRGFLINQGSSVLYYSGCKNFVGGQCDNHIGARIPQDDRLRPNPISALISARQSWGFFEENFTIDGESSGVAISGESILGVLRRELDHKWGRCKWKERKDVNASQAWDEDQVIYL
ncbi:hypothetical protein BDR07DRAFT_1380073 [Suillus spraguei]|nr:hypothetical protein BDR07DRAFT_1380073 [Suillus spraguei]